MKQLTYVAVYFNGTAKGKRKIDFQSERVVTIDGHVHVTPEQVIDIERKAWQLIDEKGYKNVSRCSLNVNIGENDGMFESIQFPAKQKILIMRTNHGAN